MSEGQNTPPPPGQEPGGPAGQPPASGPPPGQQPPPPAGQPAGAPPPQAPQAPQQPAVGVGQPADLTTRFLAKLIDWVLLGVVLMIVFGIMGALFVSAAVTGNIVGGGGFMWGLVTTLISTALVIGYFVFLESNRGQTIGKMLLKIQVQRADGSNPTMEEALKRNAYLAIYLVNIIPWVGWLISSIGMLVATIYIAVTINNNTATRQGWHDELADGTRVIKIG